MARRKTEKPEELSFILREDGTVSIAEGANADYRVCSGIQRQLLRQYSMLVPKSATLWDSVSKPVSTAAFLEMAADNVMLTDTSGNKIAIADKDAEATILVEIRDDGTSEIATAVSGERGNALLILPDVVLMNHKLYFLSHQRITDQESFSNLKGMITMENLGFYLSLALSRDEDLKLSVPGYSIEERKPEMALPALIFDAVDNSGYLHLSTKLYIEGFKPGEIENYDLIKAVSIDKDSKTVKIRDIIYPEKTPAEILWAAIGRKNKAFVYESDGNFVLEPEFAKQFMGKSFSSLLSSFVLFQTDVLGKLRIRYPKPKIHMVFSSGIDYLEGTGDVELDGEHVSLDAFISQYRENGYVMLSDKSHAYIDASFMKKLERLIRTKGGKMTVSAFDVPYIEQIDGMEISGDATKRIREFYRGLGQIGNQSYSTSIRTSKLRDYQMRGYRWLRYLHDTGMGGCLADEMGLGKTVQIIALLNDVSASRTDKPSLLIAPKSLIYNWLSEIERFGIGLKTYVYYGQDRDKDIISSMNSGIIISSYATIRNDIETIKEKEFDYVILDESQTIKHFSTKTAQAVLNLHSEHRIAVSGTPIENDLGELYSLFRFINPSIFPTLAGFERDYARPIMYDGDKDAEAELRKKISPFIMRRLKKDVLPDLPEKTEQTTYIELADEHMRYYETRRMMIRQQVQESMHKEGIGGSSFMILQALTELRQLATMPEAKMETDTVSAKREYLKEVLPALSAAGHKMLIFSSFLDPIDAISGDLTALGIKHLIMTGATTDRKALVDRFQKDPEIKAFLITLKTGGVGLNLTAADYVFIFDPWWNAAAEEQALNRTHRIGQRNPVFCYRLIAKDTIEEKMLELQMKKKELSDNLISSDSAALRTLTEAEIDELLS